MSHLRRIIPVALAIVAIAAPAAHAKLYDPNAVSSAPGHAQDLRSPDTRDLANGYMPAREQGLRAPDLRDAASESTLARARQDLRIPDTPDAGTAYPASPAIGGDARDRRHDLGVARLRRRRLLRHSRRRRCALAADARPRLRRQRVPPRSRWRHAHDEERCGARHMESQRS